jgi:hypothetical protein
LDRILSFFVLLDDQIARISRMKASIFFVIRARSGPRFCSRQFPLKNIGTHNAYHIGQIVYVRKEQGTWDPEKGVKE